MKKIKEKIYNLTITYSSKFELDLLYFIKGGFWLSIGQISSMLKAFILSLIFANLLSKEIFGQYSFVMATIGLASTFALPGMAYAIIQSVARGYDGTYFKALKQIFKWGWLGSLFLLSIAIYGIFSGRIYGAIVFLMVSFIFPFYSFKSYYSALLQGKKRFDIFAKITSLINVISVLSIVLAVFLTKSLLWIIIATIFIDVILAGYFTLFYVKKYIHNDKIEEDSIRFGKKVSFSLAFSNIANYFDSLIITYFLGFSDLAIFKIVTLLPNQIKVLANMFTPMLLPKMASKNTKKKDLMKHFKKFFLIVVFLILIYLIIAPFVFKWLYPKYYEYVWLSMIYHLSFIVVLYILPFNYLIKEKKGSLINKFYNYSAVLLIFLSLVGIYFYGLLGAIVARIVYRLFILFLTFLFFMKYCK
ncbi:oligosaccharide flippase family protein [bacterium]|nr:oligosaccharide flippase family protein [bacterium]